ncbi:MAG TPA: cytochrome c [Methyloceanibacter sp.]|nr:cytochrome c [Methyloceanibacter sp.]
MSQNFVARLFRGGNRNLLAMLGLLLAIGTSFALAHEGAKGVVKERMDLMKGQAKQMKLIGDMAKGKKKFDAAKAAAAAQDLGKTTKKIPELFPEGSNGHPSEALDAVWKEWDRFKGDAQDAEAAANALETALQALGQDWKAAFKKMTDACKSCHESFRAEEGEGEKEGHHH